ncbi:MAG: diguanylate cyclase [Proteobacteria bacterium]|nr:diguanylate cyclase [Pseudomonadota bacterium]
MRTGLIYSLITVFLWSSYAVTVRFISINWHAEPLVFVSVANLVGAIVLLVIAGRGHLGIKTIKQLHTWGYSTTCVFMDIIFMFVLMKISTTEANLLVRFSIITTALICQWGLGRKINPRNYFGFGLVAAGFFTVAYNLPDSVRPMTLFLISLVIICQTLRTYITETHPTNQEASNWGENCRVTGYVVLVTSLAFLIMGLAVAYLKMILPVEDLNSFPILSSFPDLKDFINPHTIFPATFIGIFNISLASYFYFQATKKVGSDTFLMVSALLPVSTFSLEFIASKFDLLSISSIDGSDLVAAILIISGAFWSIYTKIYLDKRKRKLAPKAQKDLEVLRETVRTTLICCGDDPKKAAKLLGIGVQTVTRILTTDYSASSKLKNKIISNHSQIVASLDFLTGALNKISFESKLRNLKEKEKALVVFIDLNKFKPVNDTYNHKTGDCILKGIAERLMNEFKAPHNVARVGGDEYCLIIYGADQKEQRKYISKIKAIVSEPFIVEGITKEISVGCSVGMAHYPTEGQNGSALQDIADKRMYEDKKLNGEER